MAAKKLIIKLLGQSREIEIIPPDHGQIVISFRDGKIVMIDETKKTQIK